MNEKTKIFLAYNSPFGALMGICFVAASFMCFRYNGNIYANVTLDRIIVFLYIIGLVMQIRRFRESEYQHGAISYGTGLLTGLYLSGIVGIIYGIYIYILYTSYPEALNSYLNTFEAICKEVYPNSSFANELPKLARSFTTPGLLGVTEFFGKIFMGFIYTLIIAGFLKKDIVRDNQPQ